MAELKVVELPQHKVSDVAGGLRRLAEQIEKGDFGPAHNLVWVIDTGNGKVEIGMLGHAGEPGAVGHLLLAMGQRRLESDIEAMG